MIDEKKIHLLLEKTKSPSKEQVIEILQKAYENAFNFKTSSEYVQGLNLEDAAILLNIDSSNKEIMDELFKAALKIKHNIYGNRIVLFAPLYVSSFCSSNCQYCGYRVENKKIQRTILTNEEIKAEVIALQQQGHKRLLMLMGDHPKYTLDNFVEAINIAANTKSSPHGEIRRINVEIPSLKEEEFKKLKDTNAIGTYALFQETYHRETYKQMHPYGPKSDYDYRLYTMDRAISSGIDDVGLGVLFGLYDYKFELLSLLTHAIYLDQKFSIGPHTISVPRLQPAFNTPVSKNPPYPVNDLDFKKIVAIIRLCVPYTGIILSTRESPQIRRELYNIGVSQISAGSKTEPGGYSKTKNDSSQFSLSDNRATSEVIYELVKMGFIPSWCTACYRNKRTGKAFMEIAKKGQIQNCCHPNALLTFYEYLIDYADDKTREEGTKLLENQIPTITSTNSKNFLLKALKRTKDGTRDLFI